MKALNLCRDEIYPFHSTIDNLYVSLDFNHSGLTPEQIEERGEPVRGIEVIIPDFIYEGTPEYSACTAYAGLLQKFFWFHGLDVPLRGNNGIKYASETGRGVEGTIHLEPFFAQDIECFDLVRRNPEWYAWIISITFGELDNITIILPHESDAGGAETPDGVSERDFCRCVIMPELSIRSE